MFLSGKSWRQDPGGKAVQSGCRDRFLDQHPGWSGVQLSLQTSAPTGRCCPQHPSSHGPHPIRKMKCVLEPSILSPTPKSRWPKMHPYSWSEKTSLCHNLPEPPPECIHDRHAPPCWQRFVFVNSQLMLDHQQWLLKCALAASSFKMTQCCFSELLEESTAHFIAVPFSWTFLCGYPPTHCCGLYIYDLACVST